MKTWLFRTRPIWSGLLKPWLIGNRIGLSSTHSSHLVLASLRVNDAEQGLIEAFRMLRNRLDCCIEGIHHSGKANSREKNLDQYAGRGGSALSDGSRMVVVMQPLNAEEWQTATGTTLGFEETGIVMALAKLSYAGQQDPIFIRRDGYSFEMTTVIRRSPDQIAKSIEEQVCQFITYEYSRDRKVFRSRPRELERQAQSFPPADPPGDYRA